jgi:hypothetical protein
MNFGILLGAGKTFFGGGNPAAYCRNKRVYLPKFNAEKNPFSPKSAEPAPAAAPEVKIVSAPVAAKDRENATAPAGNLVRAGWTTRLNPFRAPETAAPPMPNVVQPELSLDAVKVVHNDLADADIEIVPVKSRVVAPVETPVLPPARKAWEFLGDSLLKSS